MTESKKKELVSRIVRWACGGGKFRRIMAYAAIVLLLVYYHSIGKKMSVKYKEIEKDLLCEKWESKNYGKRVAWRKRAWCFILYLIFKKWQTLVSAT